MRKCKVFMQFMMVTFTTVLFLGVHTTNLFASEVIIQNDDTFDPIDESQSEVLDWDKHTRAAIDSAFTQSLATELGTDEHIVFDGTNISFYGYDQPGYLDYLYYAETDETEKTFSFTIKPGHIDTHTIVSYGFFVNCVENSDGTISGYFVSRENTSLVLRKIDGMDLPAIAARDTFQPYTSAGMDFVYGAPQVFREEVGASGTELQNIVLKSEKEKFSVAYNGEEVFALDLATATPEQVPQDYTGGNDFGLFAAYAGHACPTLSFITISDIKLHTATITPKSEVTLNFVDYVTAKEETPIILRNQFTSEGYIGQAYTITAPSFEKYIFLNDKTVMADVYEAENKTVDLYYVNPTYVVEYVDVSGKKIAEDLTVDGLQLQKYTVTAKELAGYKIEGVSTQDITLTADDSRQVITFVYEQVAKDPETSKPNEPKEPSKPKQPNEPQKPAELPKTGEHTMEQIVFGFVVALGSYVAVRFTKRYKKAE